MENVIKTNNVNSYNDLSDLLDKHDLNFQAEERELMTNDLINIPNHKAIIRGDTKQVLGIHQNTYKIIQHSEAFSFMDTLIQDKKAEYSKVIDKENGKRISIFAKFSDLEFNVKAGDTISPYLLCTNSHDGSSGFSMSIFMNRQVCTNGMVWYGLNKKVYVKHTKNAKIRMNLALEVLGMAEIQIKNYQDKCQFLAQKRIDKKMVNSFLDNLIGNTSDEIGKDTRKKGIKEDIENLISFGEGNNGSNAFDLVNAVTEYNTHHRGKDSDKRNESLLFGSSDKLNQRAFNLALTI